MKQTSKLELRLLNYFLLIAIAAMMIGVEFYFEMKREGLQQEICLTPEQIAATKSAVSDDMSGDIVNTISDASFPETSPALENLRNKIVVMFGILTIVVAIVMMMFVKNITNPLIKTLAIAKQINDGDLSKVIEIDANDEIGQIGTVINDLTSNFQEIATSTSAMINAIESKLDGLTDGLPKEDEACVTQIKNIKEDLETLRSFVDSFDLLETEIPE